MNDAGDELFSRWMAHREGEPEPESGGAHAAAPVPSAPSEAPTPTSTEGPARGPDSTAAGAAVLAALTQAPAAPAAPASTLPAAPVEPVAPPAPVELPPTATAASVRPPDAKPGPVTGVKQPSRTPAAVVPRDYAFRPRRATRTTLTTALLGWILASVAMGLVAYQDRSTTSYSIAGLVVLLTVITWAVRAGTTVARLRIVGGILQIRRGGRTDVFSLIDAYQRIEVVGRPGGLNWQVRFVRHGTEPYVVDGSMVQPKEFMQVLAYYRPSLAAGSAATS